MSCAGLWRHSSWSGTRSAPAWQGSARRKQSERSRSWQRYVMLRGSLRGELPMTGGTRRGERPVEERVEAERERLNPTQPTSPVTAARRAAVALRVREHRARNPRAGNRRPGIRRSRTRSRSRSRSRRRSRSRSLTVDTDGGSTVTAAPRLDPVGRTRARRRPWSGDVTGSRRSRSPFSGTVDASAGGSQPGVPLASRGRRPRRSQSRTTDGRSDRTPNRPFRGRSLGRTTAQPPSANEESRKPALSS
ncbi:hypothetical protein ZHAS_00010366 [Anopheles sinensis]|uniref:Uncharacterized protein n=1 Tax=Anopheles sinensis TaxID=74873 RepID=A0A084VXE1_ANOSI|nr:hypothetical protein ZHAS_00010366 [Anopheles sinensis]